MGVVGAGEGAEDGCGGATAFDWVACCAGGVAEVLDGLLDDLVSPELALVVVERAEGLEGLLNVGLGEPEGEVELGEVFR